MRGSEGSSPGRWPSAARTRVTQGQNTHDHGAHRAGVRGGVHNLLLNLSMLTRPSSLTGCKRTRETTCVRSSERLCGVALHAAIRRPNQEPC